MKILFSIPMFMLIFFGFGVGTTSAQVTVQFEKHFGEPGWEYANSVEQTSDGGYIITGSTNSFGGGTDFYLVKTDANGESMWSRVYGGPYEDRGGQTKQTADGGYIVVGWTRSYGLGSRDVWLIKTDANGAVLWTKTFGSTSSDSGVSIDLTADGGYIIAGQTFGFGGAKNDIYLIKTDAAGNLVFQETYDFGSWEGAWYVEQTSDGGYIIGGRITVKTDSLGNMVWAYYCPYGTPVEIHETTDGGYIAAGYTNNLDVLLIKLDAGGALSFVKTYGGSLPEWGLSVIQTTDGGYAVGGETLSYGQGGSDVWLLKTDSNGDILWTQTFGTPGDEYAYEIRQTSDGGYVLVGPTNSYGAGGQMYMLKVLEVPAFATIEGSVFVDSGAICPQGLLEKETGMMSRMVSATDQGGNSYFAITDRSGAFSYKVPAGTYDLRVIHNDITKETCNAGSGLSYKVTVGKHETVKGIEFFVASDCSGTAFVSGERIPGSDFSCPPAVQTSPCETFPWKYCATFTNTGSNDFSTSGPGTAYQLQLDPSMTPVPGPVPVLQCTGGQTYGGTYGGGIFDWSPSGNDPDLAPNESCNVCVDVEVGPGSPPFMTTASFVAFNAKCAPQFSFSDSFTLAEGDTCACDPNDKRLVSPVSCGSEGNIARHEPLVYKVRFENVGPGNAHDIVIRDTLDGDLDITTLQFLSTSHPYTRIQVSSDNELVIEFIGIELPGILDPMNNKGYVFFSIRHHATALNATQITNQAAIYFDGNEPVMTNTTLNTIRDTPSPVADFETTRQCASVDNVFDFTYRGGTVDNATFLWDFGPGATPSTSTDENPMGVAFANPGQQEVTLTVTRFGCTASIAKTIWVEDVNCGKYKVTTCHVPPGNPENTQTLCVSQNALGGHLAHADCIGSCAAAL